VRAPGAALRLHPPSTTADRSAEHRSTRVDGRHRDARGSVSATPGDHRFVFVGGLHRSGTSLMARTIAGHPEVSAFTGTGVPEDEGQHLQTVYPKPSARQQAGRFAFVRG